MDKGRSWGWKIDRGNRERLLAAFPPRYAEVVADHVTHKPDGSGVPAAARIRIVGHVDDGKGVEAMVVTVDGETARPDGSIYHITWSLGPGRRAVESNDVLKERGWKELDHPVPVEATPARFP